ncbi:MAG: hypothetical protein N2558_02135 [Patescibacteria group bacterium]|nr:hypothetical protein [Patescibacteria group bacterium]
MSTIEGLLNQYYAGWKNQPDNRVVVEVASVYLEQKHLPESYGFKITSNGLVDNTSGKLVRSFIARNTRTDQIEGEAFDKIEKWAVEYGLKQGKNAISSIWISPPSADRSEDTKFIISTIQKKLVGTSQTLQLRFFGKRQS